ncbi:MAG: 30S ribosomal protein S6 [Thermomicrobiales bacterium]
MARPAPRPRKYEMMIVVAPTVTEDDSTVVERVTGLIEAQDGTIESFTHDSPWGHRRLAYPIQNFRDAFYVLYYFNIAPRAIAELDRELRLDDAIIRHLIVKFDPLADREGPADSDDEDDDDFDGTEDTEDETPDNGETEASSDNGDSDADDSEDESSSDAGDDDDDDSDSDDDDESEGDDSDDGEDEEED